MGASYIEYDGFLPTGAATFTPAIRFDTRDISFGAQGSWQVFESGNQILQANAGAAWLAPTRSRVRLELSAAGGVSKYAEQSAAGHLLARSRVHLFADRYGGWLTAGAGMAFDSTSSTPLEIGVGAWSVHEPFALVGTTTVAWINDESHVDVTAAARWTRRNLQLEARVGARPWASSPGLTGDATIGMWGELSTLLTLSRQLSLAFSGGSYPADPVRRVLGAKYFTAGVRVALSGREYAAPLPVSDMLATARRSGTEGNAADTRLEIVPVGAGHVVRVRVRGARSVELMGDFTDWQPVTLEHTREHAWEIELQLSRVCTASTCAWMAAPGSCRGARARRRMSSAAWSA